MSVVTEAADAPHCPASADLSDWSLNDKAALHFWLDGVADDRPAARALYVHGPQRCHAVSARVQCTHTQGGSLPRGPGCYGGVHCCSEATHLIRDGNPDVSALLEQLEGDAQTNDARPYDDHVDVLMRRSASKKSP